MKQARALSEASKLKAEPEPSRAELRQEEQLEKEKSSQRPNTDERLYRR